MMKCSFVTAINHDNSFGSTLAHAEFFGAIQHLFIILFVLRLWSCISLWWNDDVTGRSSRSTMHISIWRSKTGCLDIFQLGSSRSTMHMLHGTYGGFPKIMRLWE
jgi:hypothetical protein